MLRQQYLTKKLFLNYCYIILMHIALSSPASAANISNIELVGTITGKRSFAVLRIPNNSEGIYQINQTILGYTIKTISKKSVILTKGQHTVKLSLLAIKERQYYGLNTNPVASTPLKTHEYRINRNTFNSIKNDTQFWLDTVRFELQIQDGFLSGYTITKIQKNSPAELLGLVEGDIIKGINGVLIKQNTTDFIKKISLLENVNQLTLNMSHSEVDFNLKFIIEDDTN